MRIFILSLLLVFAGGCGNNTKVLPEPNCFNYSIHTLRLCLNDNSCNAAARALHSTEDELRQNIETVCLEKKYTENNIECALQKKSMSEFLKEECFKL